MTRAERQAAREERQRNREARSKAKAERIAGREARTKAENAPPPISLPQNSDPLKITDSKGVDIGHAIRNLWAPNPAFLVGGGPSINEIDYMRLAERGVVSLGVNNIAAKVPVRAWTWSDTPSKFHHGCMFDPAMLKFIPVPKLKKRVRAKISPNRFQHTAFRCSDCPSVFGYHRNTKFHPDKFLTTEIAMWGQGKQGHIEYEKMNLKPRPQILFTFFLGIRLLHYLGIRRMYLLGVDFTMGPGKGQGYAFEQDRWAGAVSGNNKHYSLASSMLAELKPHFEEAGLQIFNCNPTSHLEIFDHVPFEQAIKDAKGGVPEEPFDCRGWYERTVDGKLPDKEKSEKEKQSE